MGRTVQWRPLCTVCRSIRASAAGGHSHWSLSLADPSSLSSSVSSKCRAPRCTKVHPCSALMYHAMQATRHASKQVDNQACKQVGNQACMQAGRQPTSQSDTCCGRQVVSRLMADSTWAQQLVSGQWTDGWHTVDRQMVHTSIRCALLAGVSAAPVCVSGSQQMHLYLMRARHHQL